jgi:hypothetical protein
VKYFIKVITVLLIVAGSSSDPAYAQGKYRACAGAKNFRTVLKVDLAIPDPHFDFSQTRRQLNNGREKMHEEWLKKNGMQTVWSADKMETVGQAAGGWGFISQFRSVAKPYDMYGMSYCPYFSAIELNMIYRTIISIPKNFKKGSCAFNIIMEHEMRHHATNVAVAQEVVARLKKDLPTIIEEIETSGSYVSRNLVNARFQYLQASLEDAINVYVQQSMTAEMRRRNNLIDSPEEYERSSRAMDGCADMH